MPEMGIVEEEIRKAKEKALDYSGYGLEFNPFPPTGISPDTTNVEIIRDFLKKYFFEKIREKEIKELVKALVRIGYVEKTAGHMWLWGDWRVGKSALLMRLFVGLHDKLPDAVTVYVPKPRYGLVKSCFYYFIREYSSTFFQELTKKVLIKLVVENPTMFDEDWIETWKETSAELKSKTKEECGHLLVDEIKKELLDIFALLEEGAVDPDALYSKAVSEFAKEGVTTEVIDLLVDHSLDPEARYSRLFQLEGKRDYADHIVGLFKICRMAGYQHIFVFVDDVEDIVRTWTRGKAEKEIDGLNNFLDRMHSDLSMLGTMHAQFFSIFEERYARFVGRASADPLNFSLVQVKPLESEAILGEVVSFFISKASQTTPPHPTYPFENEVIKALHESLQGKLGLVLPSLYHLLMKAAEKGTETGNYPKIDLKFYEGRKKEVLGAVS